MNDGSYYRKFFSLFEHLREEVVIRYPYVLKTLKTTGRMSLQRDGVKMLVFFVVMFVRLGLQFLWYALIKRAHEFKLATENETLGSCRQNDEISSFWEVNKTIWKTGPQSFLTGLKQGWYICEYLRPMRPKSLKKANSKLNILCS